MAGDYPEKYGRNNFRPHDHDRSQHDAGGFFDRMGNKLHQTWDRLTGDEDESRREQARMRDPYQEESSRRNSPYGASASNDYGSGSRYGERGSQSGGGSGYGASQMGRYSPQSLQGGGYERGRAYGSERNSSTGYSGRMSDYGGPSQQRAGGGDQSFQSQRGSYGSGDSAYGASGSSYSYGDAAGYGAPSGGYGRSSMGFPRGSDYGSGGSGSMGGGYFGSGAGPWSGGPYGDTGSGGYTPQRNQDKTSDSDYQYSRREQRRRGESDQGYGNPYEW